MYFNPSQNNKIEQWSKLKGFPDYKFIVAHIVRHV